MLCCMIRVRSLFRGLREEMCPCLGRCDWDGVRMWLEGDRGMERDAVLHIDGRHESNWIRDKFKMNEI